MRATTRHRFFKDFGEAATGGVAVEAVGGGVDRGRRAGGPVVGGLLEVATATWLAGVKVKPQA